MLEAMTQPQTPFTKTLAAAPYPLAWICAQYPALQTDEVFLDNAAGAQVPRAVLGAVQNAMTTMQVNKGGAYAASKRVTEAKERVRARVAAFVGAPGPRNVVFGPNASTLLELLASSVGETLQPGDEVIVSGLDHHANVDPWRRLAARGAVLKTWLPRAPEMTLELSDLEALLGPKTRVVAVTAASNALGTLTNPKATSERVHAAGGEVGARLVIDAVHYAPHALPDVTAWGADALVFSPYKVFGPHLGVLYLNDERLTSLPAPRLAFLPEGEPIAWEPGTQNHEAILGFGGVFEYLDEAAAQLGLGGTGRALWAEVFGHFAAHEQNLLRRLLVGLEGLGAELYGVRGPEGRTATVSFNLPGRAPARVAEHLAAQGVGAASGHFYAHDLVMKYLGLAERGGAVRLSALHYTSEADIDRVLGALEGP